MLFFYYDYYSDYYFLTNLFISLEHFGVFCSTKIQLNLNLP